MTSCRARLVRASAALLVAIVLTTLVTACSGSDEASGPRTGAQIYRATCATCHGRDGSGFVGPSLYDVAQRFPDESDQVALVTNGRGQMPGFGGRLSAAEIEAVVEYERSTFVTDQSTSTTLLVGPTLPTTTGG